MGDQINVIIALAEILSQLKKENDGLNVQAQLDKEEIQELRARLSDGNKIGG